jgi:hypothetical protein
MISSSVSAASSIARRVSLGSSAIARLNACARLRPRRSAILDHTDKMVPRPDARGHEIADPLPSLAHWTRDGLMAPQRASIPAAGAGIPR